MPERMDLDKASDEELVDEAKAAAPGDFRAFEELMHRHEAKVVTNCRYISGSPSDAPDLAQEVFVKAFFAIPRFEGRSSFKTWIQRIKTNHCLNFVKKANKRSYVDVDDAGLRAADELSVRPDAPGNLEAMDERARISFVLDQMTETLRVPLLMRDMDGFSYQEIADELGVGLSAVKMRILRARDEFREHYEALAERMRDGGQEQEA